jgi:hypothetical protein
MQTNTKLFHQNRQVRPRKGKTRLASIVTTRLEDRVARGKLVGVALWTNSWSGYRLTGACCVTYDCITNYIWFHIVSGNLSDCISLPITILILACHRGRRGVAFREIAFGFWQSLRPDCDKSGSGIIIPIGCVSCEELEVHFISVKLR